jgi:NarL family two-component system response regulator LiaR
LGQLARRSLTNQEIANRLVISESTVHTRVRNILGKPHLANRTQAALYALREGIAGLDDNSSH